MADRERARRVARGIRRRVLEHTLAVGGGYMSQACSAADLLATLYSGVMRLGPSLGPAVPPPFAGVPGPRNKVVQSGGIYNGPREPELDRFFLSPVHYALVLYATLIETGRLGADGLDDFNLDGSTVEMIGAEHSPGRGTAGSLSQAISQVGGIAMARRRKGETGRCFLMISDGEQEGQTWEAFAALAHFRLDSVLVYIDANGQQCDGAVAEVLGLEPIAARLTAFGARVFEVDGHDPAALAAPAFAPPDGRPVAVVARTDPCRGLELLRARAPQLHYLRFKNDIERAAYRAALAEI